MPAARNDPDDGEWEYEYSETEVQDFFITLDLTSHSMPVQSKKRHSRFEHDLFAVNEIVERGDPANADDETAVPRDRGTFAPAEPDRVQIIELHGDNPIVSYRGQVYSCYWASTIGTDLLFTSAHSPDHQDDQAAQPLRRFGTFDLTGASSAHLVASPVSLKPKSEASIAEQPRPVPSAHTLAPVEHAHGTETVEFTVPPGATRAQQRQAAFLQQLSTVKARLGEKDKVKATAYTDSDEPVGKGSNVVSSAPMNHEEGPPGQRTQRARAKRGSVTRARRAGRPEHRRRSLRNEPAGAGGPCTGSATPATWDRLHAGEIEP